MAACAACAADPAGTSSSGSDADTFVPWTGEEDAVVVVGEGDATETLGPTLTAELMYALEVIPELHIEIDEDGIAALGDDPKTYVPGKLRHGSDVAYPVGVRLKGSATLTTLDEKPSFRIKINAYLKGQTFAGREGLMLHNLHSDESMVREHLAYAIFRAAGVPAPRTGYAWVVVNGEPYGLYLNVEPYDDDFLAHAFADPKGNLYEGDSGDDLDGDIWKYDQDEGKDTSRADLQAFADAAEAGGEAFFFGPDSPLDVDEFMRYVAVEGMLGHYEGYQAPHNYFIYHQPDVDKWVFLPWNTDQTLRRKTSAFAGEGVLTRTCIDDYPLCRLQYVTTAQQVGQAVADFDPVREVDEVTAFIEAAALADTRKRYSNESVASNQTTVRSRAASWLGSFQAEVDCLIGGEEPDLDGDGYGACYHDCADGDPDIHPGVDEPCDGVDNDCSGWADDVPECPCPSDVIEGAEFFFCTHTRSWKAGKSFCEAQGNQLARIDTESQNVGVWEAAQAVKAGAWAIGLNDMKVEDEYVWLDGSEPALLPWGDGEPAKTLPWFDCVYYVGGSVKAKWRERNCAQKGFFICRGP